MGKKNIVFIAKSLDGYIADKEGNIDWLHSVPNPDHNDMGFINLMQEIDAVVMGRNTYEVVLNFEGDWPYSKPVFVLSNTLESIPESISDKVSLIKGTLQDILKQIHGKGYTKLYIDGGKTIQSFLREKLIDELIITTIPILLGGGSTLFGNLSQPINLEHLESKVFLNQIVQNHYRVIDNNN
jgi:dihydrofolate reductase